ncbi:MAG: hypothetical protein NVSMB3_06270 [Acidobacteriaceae bacterium]
MAEVPEGRGDGPAARGVLLPGVAGIAMFLLLLALLNTFAAVKGVYGSGGGRYGVLGVCTLLVVGVFGLLKMRRWGWAIVTAGALLLAMGYLFVFSRTHSAPMVVQALFGLVFFLYLVRTEVRERLH